MYKLMALNGRIICVNKIEGNTVMSIPFVKDNTDYANFKKDLADGAELQDAEGNVIDGIAYLEELS